MCDQQNYNENRLPILYNLNFHSALSEWKSRVIHKWLLGTASEKKAYPKSLRTVFFLFDASLRFG